MSVSNVVQDKMAWSGVPLEFAFVSCVRKDIRCRHFAAIRDGSQRPTSKGLQSEHSLSVRVVGRNTVAVADARQLDLNR